MQYVFVHSHPFPFYIYVFEGSNRQCLQYGTQQGICLAKTVANMAKVVGQNCHNVSYCSKRGEIM